MIVETSNTYAEVVAAEDRERRWLTTFLTFEDTTARFRHDRKSRISVYEPISRRFPRGFLHLVRRGAAEPNVGLKVEVVDSRAAPCSPDASVDLAVCQRCRGTTIDHTTPDGKPGASCPGCVDPATGLPTGKWLRDYQLAAEAAAERGGQGILWAPTGSGKTEIGAALVRRLPCRWMFFVHRSQLVLDAADRYELRTGDRAGRIAEGEWSEGERLTCATYQTFHDALVNGAHPHHADAERLARDCGGFVADEGHVLGATTFWSVAMGMTGAYYRIAMSGTPLDRTDKRSIMVTAATGPILHRIRTEALIAAGVLSRPLIRMVPLRQFPHVRGEGEGDETHQQVYAELVVDSAERNRVLALMARASAKPALLFVKEVGHGKELLRHLKRAKLRADFVWGSDSVARRRAALMRLVRGDLDVLVCSVIFQEGIDVPSLRSVIVGSGGQSGIAALQRIGRGMRSAAGKGGFEVWDVMDQGQGWLQRHAAKRFRAYAKEGHEVREFSAEELELAASAAGQLPGTRLG